MERPLDYSGLTTFEIREIVSTIDFHELEKVHKGDTLFECFKYRSVKTIVISDPQKIIVESTLKSRIVRPINILR